MKEGNAISLPKGWEVKKLGEICEFENGDRGVNYPSKSHRTEMGIPFINAGHLTSNGLDIYSMDYISKERFDLLGSGKVQKGDILFCLRGSLGKFAKVHEFSEGAIASSLVIVRPKSKVTSDFLMIYFESKICADMITDFANGAAQPNLSAGNLKNFIIPLPPLSEQQRIVAILDEAFAGIAKAKAKAEQNLKNAKELFESYLQGVFENKGEGWEEKTLEQISKSFGRGKSRHRPRNFEGLYGGAYPFIQTGDIRNCNHYITEYTQTYNDLGLAQSKLWPAGTICITIAANIAETGVLTFDACFPDSVIGVVVNENLADRDFVEYLLQSFKARIQSLGKGSAQANINMGTFENELFPFPTVAEQKEIVQKLNALSAETKRLEGIYQQKINDLEELKKSVLQKAFRGELRSPEGAEYRSEGHRPSLRMGKNIPQSPERA
ncbi:restriction endonuclease subunit S [Runella sp.]|uniref:restriction endonuclease subunit S n=1 Tax=Runella sp. TaxID=1960881 RepID=UPI00260E4B5C|nr:restriction endonuclease subunit S [Runella sp.]